MGTKNNPGSYDCYANAEPDEPMFVLLGRDPAAAVLVRAWLAIRREMDYDAEVGKYEEALACAAKMEEWARSKGKGERVDKVNEIVLDVVLADV
jgi:hypothetical protein